MVSSLAAAPEPASAPATPVYQPHGRSDFQRLFHERFPAFATAYEEKYAADFGKFRLPLISAAASAFDACGASPVGDWENGIARIRCPDCGYDYFRPFSCKSFFLCPSCGQKRTLLLGEYLAEDLLLRLPHRQFGAHEVRDGRFLKQGLLDEALAESMLGWQHSGFSVEAGTRVYDDAACQSLYQYIVRPPVGLEKLTWDPDED